MNEEYGFSVKYPKDWVPNPDLIQSSKRYVAAFYNFNGSAPGIAISIYDADKPLSVDWLIASYQEKGHKDINVVSPLTETTLADGTKATMCKTTFIARASDGNDYGMVALNLDADKGGERIHAGVYTLEDSTPPYNEKLFSQVAHTLRFTADE